MGKGKGKQKIEIKYIDNPKRRAVTFTKRRQGLFKKAQQFYDAFGVEMAIVAISEAGNLFSTGYPSADAVISRYYQSSHGLDNHRQEQAGEESQLAKLQEKLEQLTKLRGLLIAREKERSDTCIAAATMSCTSSGDLQRAEDGGSGETPEEEKFLEAVFDGLEPLDIGDYGMEPFHIGCYGLEMFDGGDYGYS